MPLREQDRFLPIANVAKIMKKAIPESGKVNHQSSLHFTKVLNLVFATILWWNFFSLLGLQIKNLIISRLQKMPGNVFKSVYQNSSVLSQVRHQIDVTWRRERPSMEKTFYLPCQLLALTAMWNHWRYTSKNIGKQPRVRSPSTVKSIRRLVWKMCFKVSVNEIFLEQQQ